MEAVDLLLGKNPVTDSLPIADLLKQGTKLGSIELVELMMKVDPMIIGNEKVFLYFTVFCSSQCR